MAWCRKYCRALQQDLDMHHPIFLQICSNLHMPDPSNWEQRFLLGFLYKLGEGKSLVESCLHLKLGWVNVVSRIRYSRKILKLREDILQHLQQLSALNTLQLQQINIGLQDVREQQDRDHAEVMGALKSGNPLSPMNWARYAAPASGKGDHVEEDQLLGNQLDELMNQRQLLIGLDNNVNQLKSVLLSEGLTITIVEGMGGIGKTTLAVSICKDPEIRGFFYDRIHFFCVSQFPDMKSLLLPSGRKS
ncbi:hypothetical protein L7F22_035420 [Adiantum nelumboides]|nr:hypothetical protein [Adiantum nelumboides]